MSRTINIDFSSVTEVKANNVDLSAVYITTISLANGEKNTVLVWNKPDISQVTFSLLSDTGILFYTRTVASGTKWAAYTETNTDFFLIPADPSNAETANVVFQRLISSYFVMWDGKLVKGGDIIMGETYTLLPRT